MNPNAARLLRKLVEWAEARPDIRAVILTGSCARNGQADRLSDLDIELFCADPNAYIGSDRWLPEIDEVWTHLSLQTNDGHPTRLVIFRNGAKVDFTLYPNTVLIGLVEGETLPHLYERGYRVLLDKDQFASRLPALAGEASTMKAPTEKEFAALIQEFWFEAYHVAKYLKREDLWAVKYRDWKLKELLLKMIEWHGKSLHGWDYDTKHLGTRMKEWAEPEVWERLQSAFGRFDAHDSWRALEATINLFRTVAREAAKRTGYEYPNDVDRNVGRYVDSLRSSD